jgi:hypothetical protein
MEILSTKFKENQPLLILSFTETTVTPFEHKVSAINYLVNTMNTYPIPKKGNQEELQTIKDILNYDQHKTHILKPHQKVPN